MQIVSIGAPRGAGRARRALSMRFIGASRPHEVDPRGLYRSSSSRVASPRGKSTSRAMSSAHGFPNHPAKSKTAGSLSRCQSSCASCAAAVSSTDRTRLERPELRFAKRSSGRSSRVLSVEETAAAHDAHDDWQRERDPAVLLFAGWFGKPWAELMAREVLFPRGLATRELEER